MSSPIGLPPMHSPNEEMEAEMDGLPWGVILAAAIGAAGLMVVRWAAGVVVRKKIFGPAVRDLEQTLPRLQRELLQYRDLPRTEQIARSARILAMITRANTNLRALDDARRRRYELRLSEIRGMAAGVGFQWGPPGARAR